MACSYGYATDTRHCTATPNAALAAEDFLELGKQSTGHIETNDYYEYKNRFTSREQEEKAAAHNDSNQFDSALLSDEGKAPADERPAYCVIALADKEVCPPTATTQTVVAKSLTSTTATTSLAVNPAGALTKYRVSTEPRQATVTLQR